jgi:hypothetical protein
MRNPKHSDLVLILYETVGIEPCVRLASYDKSRKQGWRWQAFLSNGLCTIPSRRVLKWWELNDVLST